MNIVLSDTLDLPLQPLRELYEANQWSSAKMPDRLWKALHGSHRVVSAWLGSRLVGLGNAISDGHLVVYYPHLLVLPEYQRRGVGGMILERLKSLYAGFHQHMLVADGRSIAFYEKHGFVRAGNTEPMWIYHGEDH